MSSDLFADRAHARASDPQTSHEAAAAVTPGLPALQASVEVSALRFPDGFTDIDLIESRRDLGPSTVRTRRCELAARNIILDSGRRAVPEGHTQRHTVWVHRSFVPDAPAIQPPPGPPQAADRTEGLATAHRMDGWAAQMRAEGRAMFADQLIDAAKLMRSLCA